MGENRQNSTTNHDPVHQPLYVLLMRPGVLQVLDCRDIVTNTSRQAGWREYLAYLAP